VKRLTAIALILSMTGIASEATAQPQHPTIEEGCLGDRCTVLSVVGQQEIWRGAAGNPPDRIIRVNMEGESFTEPDRSDRNLFTRTTWVQCSTQEPFVALRDEEWWIIDFINPVAEERIADPYALVLPDPFISSRLTYWGVCHNIWNADVTTPGGELATTAQELGYVADYVNVQRYLRALLFEQP
jgi:hypothetical protein